MIEGYYENVKLIITDLDFTLLHTDKIISEYSRNIFRKYSDYGIRNISTTLKITVATDMGVLWNSHNITESSILYKAIYNDYSKPINSCAYKIVSELPDKKIALSISNKFSDCKLICYRGENLYSFVNKNAGKVQSIKSLVKYLNIELSNIIAFGYDLNDIEMLEQCGYGIAVSNAIEEVLNVADYITDDNDECNTTVTHTIIFII